MWYLQTDLLLRMLLASLGAAGAATIAGHFGREKAIPKWYLLLDLALIFYVSWTLGIFYVAYTLLTFGFLRLLLPLKRGRKAVFVLLCLSCTLPFFYSRAAGFFPEMPLGIVLVGFSYNMLKAVDALYYTYYTEERIPFLTYANFLLFFPVITAGPIFRYRDFQKAYNNPVLPEPQRLTALTKRLIWGLFKKVVILTLLPMVVNVFQEKTEGPILSLVLLASSYATLLLDMSGYADIAIAVGGYMGITVPENFKNPLASPSMTQFWRNWHVTLSDWIREHIFVVLRGRKLSKLHGACIGFISMVVMCLWHGFSRAYLLDGLYLGSLLAVENLLGWTTVKKRKVKKSYYYFRCALTTFLFSLSSSLLILGEEQTLRLLWALVGR